MSFSIDLGCWNSVFVVPCDVVDKHIKLAGSAQLKVLLWILRHSGENFTVDDLGVSLSMNKADVNDAMQYWIETKIITENNGIIEPAKDNLKTVDLKCNNNENRNLQGSILKDNKRFMSRSVSRPQKPDSEFLAKRISESEEIAFLMQEAQVILGKPISTGDSATLLMLHDTDGLPVDVIIMLLQYAVSVGKGHMRYIEKVGIRWADEGIDSLEKAEKKIRYLSDMKKAWSIVEKITGIEHHSPTLNEKKFADKWVNEWNFTDDMIREAYERCVDNTGRFTFKYTDKILERWLKMNIKNIKEANEEKNASKRSKLKQENNKPSYDIEAYEKRNIFGD